MIGDLTVNDVSTHNRQAGACPTELRLSKSYFVICAYVAILFAASGCNQSATKPLPVEVPSVKVWTIRERERWQAADFFSDAESLHICEAISADDNASLMRLIEGKVDLNVRGKGGFTFLHWAVAENNLAAFEALLMRGADPDQILEKTILGKHVTFHKGESVIFTSIRTWHGKFSVAALRYSKNVNQRVGKDNVLHVFFQSRGYSKDIMRDLIASGIDVNAVGSFGYTPCHYAAYGRPEACIPLLEAGADPGIRDDEGRDIPAALEFKRVQLLQAKQDVAVYDNAIAWLKQRSAIGAAPTP